MMNRRCMDCSGFFEAGQLRFQLFERATEPRQYEVEICYGMAHGIQQGVYHNETTSERLEIITEFEKHHDCCVKIKRMCDEDD